MKSSPLLVSTMIAFAVCARAQDLRVPGEADSVADPLVNRKYGLEFSPIRLLVGFADPGAFGARTQISGVFSSFAIDRHAEIAFPFLVALGSKENIPLRVLNLDVTYRRFLGQQQRGFYVSGGIRYGYASGVELVDREPTGRQIVHSKAGAYAGFGYRYVTQSGFYWGTNIVLGGYLGDFSRRAGEADLDDGPFLIDSELLKIGYAF